MQGIQDILFSCKQRVNRLGAAGARSAPTVAQGTGPQTGRRLRRVVWL
jgi:hypothetical protein